MKYILILILFIAGCCPKITEHTTIQRDTTIAYVRDTITIPEIKEVFVANIQDLCDSINKKNKTTWEKIQYTIRGKKNSNSTLKILVDTSQNAEFIATINNYQHISDSLREVIKINESRSTTQITNKCDSKFHIFCVWIFFLVVMCVALYIVTRK